MSARYTAQWSARAPSTCGALTSAFCCSSVRSAAASPFITASATSLLPAATTEVRLKPDATIASVTAMERMCRVRIVPLHQFRQPAGAVALHVLPNAVQVEYRQQQISRRHRLAFEREMAIAL